MKYYRANSNTIKPKIDILCVKSFPGTTPWSEPCRQPVIQWRLFREWMVLSKLRHPFRSGVTFYFYISSITYVNQFSSLSTVPPSDFQVCKDTSNRHEQVLLVSNSNNREENTKKSGKNENAIVKRWKKANRRSYHDATIKLAKNKFQMEFWKT